MNQKILVHLICWLSILLILSLGGSTTLAKTETTLPISQALQASDPTLDVCLEQEPSTLYLYGNDFVEWAMAVVQSAIYDGPIDNLSFDYQPVILQRLPSLENGDAVLEAVTVNEGDTVVNDAGDVVTLVIGEVIRPSGCRSSDCAITYSGVPIEMDRFQVNFYMLAGLTWSDGTTLTTADSIYSFNLAADPATPSSKFVVERTASYTAPSDTQVVWTGLPGFILSDYFTNFWTPFPQHLWGSYTPAELITAEISSRTPLGWGPYVIDEWISGDRITLHKNAIYFRADEGLPEFENLVFHFTSDPMGEILAGNCDLAPSSTVHPDTLHAYDEQGYIKVVASQSGTTWEHLDFGIQPSDAYDGFAAQTLAFQDVRVRQAFAYCLDRQAIAQAAYGVYGVVPNAYIPDNHPYYPADAVVYGFDPAQGRGLLEAAGWVDSNRDGVRDQGGIEFSVYLVTTDATQRQIVAGMIASQMLGNCGVEVIPDHRPASEVFAGWPDGPIFGRKFDLSEFAWITGVQPPCELYLSSEIPSDANSGAGQNDTGYSNALYDAACNNAVRAIDESDKKTFHGQAVKIFTQDLPVLPLFSRITVGIVASEITDFALDATEFPLWNLEAIGFGESAAIPTSGGGLDSPDDTTAYVFEAGTFAGEVEVTHVTLSPADVPDFQPLLGIGHFFTVSAMDSGGQPVEPQKPYELSIQYTDGELSPAFESTLALYYWDDAQEAWVKEPSWQLDPATNTLSASPDHFSIWVVLADTRLIYLPVITH